MVVLGGESIVLRSPSDTDLIVVRAKELIREYQRDQDVAWIAAVYSTNVWVDRDQPDDVSRPVFLAEPISHIVKSVMTHGHSSRLPCIL